jgi:hypothetical protein
MIKQFFILASLGLALAQNVAQTPPKDEKLPGNFSRF